MADMAILIDTTKCTGCRGCQVACKQWNCLPWEKGKRRKFFAHKKRRKRHLYGPGYQNPRKLTERTWTLVKFATTSGGNDLDANGNWNFLKFQCMHCINAMCMTICPVGAIKRSPEGFTYVDPVLCRPGKCDTGLGPMCTNGCPFRAIKVGFMPCLVTVTPKDVQAGDSIKINTLVFTAHATTTTTANREFSIAGDDTADAGELVTCINDPTDGVPGVTASNTGAVITLSSYCAVKIKIPKANVDATFIVGKKKAYKCRGCYDRAGYNEPTVPATPSLPVTGLIPACVKTCPTDALDYDTRANVVTKAQARVAALLALGSANKYPNVEAYNIAGRYGGGHVIYVLAQPPAFYGLPDLGT